MNSYEITVDIAGRITFEVEAESEVKAKEMVDNMLNKSTFRKLAEQGRFSKIFSDIKNQDKNKKVNIER